MVQTRVTECTKSTPGLKVATKASLLRQQLYRWMLMKKSICSPPIPLAIKLVDSVTESILKKAQFNMMLN